MNDKEIQTQRAKAEIGAWLESPDKDYAAGLVLFGKYSRNRGMLQMFYRKRLPDKLEYELKKLSERASIRPANIDPETVAAISAVQKITNSEVVSIEENTEKENADRTDERIETEYPPSYSERPNKIRREDLPEDLHRLYDKNVEDYKLMRAVHEKMKLAGADEERAKFRAELDRYDDAVRDRWAAMDAWAENGTLPEKKTEHSGKLSVQEVNKHRATISRKLGELERGISDEGKKEQAATDLRNAVEALSDDGQSLKPGTTNRVIKFIPDYVDS